MDKTDKVKPTSFTDTFNAAASAVVGVLTEAADKEKRAIGGVVLVVVSSTGGGRVDTLDIAVGQPDACTFGLAMAQRHLLDKVTSVVK